MIPIRIRLRDLWQRYRLHAIAFAAGAAVLFITEQFADIALGEARARLRVQITNEAGLIRSRLEGEINASAHLTLGLMLYVGANPGFSSSEFERIAARMRQNARHLRNVALAPDNVIRHVSPLAGNEAALGLRYLENAAQRDAVLRMMETGESVLAGPVDLVQGGRGIINRVPIFHMAEGTGGERGRYWGLASIVLDVSTLLAAAGVSEQVEDVRFALRGRDGLGAAGEVFFGDPDVFANRPILLEVAVPGGKWQLAALPVRGWSGPGVPVLPHVIGLVLAALIGLLVYAWLNARERANERLKVLVANRTAELQATLSELESFAYSVSHDLRVPLRGIDGFTALAEEAAGSALPAEARGFLARARSSARRMGELIDALLSFSRLAREELRPEEVDLGALAREVLAGFALEYPGRAIEADIEEDLRAHGDPRLLRVVLESLLGNALKFSSRREVTRVSLRRDAAAGRSAFVVTDNGEGFDMRYVGRLFRVFERLHVEADFPGTGIGLARARRILIRHGGEIWARSEPGQGASVHFTLPLPPPAA